MSQTVLRLVGQGDGDKQRALEAAIAQIDRAFGKGSVMKLGSRDLGLATDDAVSTGSLGLDYSAGHWRPAARPGDRNLSARNRQARPRWRCMSSPRSQKKGGTAAFVDAEHALDPVYAGKLGVDINELLVSQPDTGEQALEITDTLVRSGGVDIVVIDSVAALTPKAELEGEMGDSLPGLQARLMSQALRKLTGSISKSNTIVLFINQIRMKIGVMYGSPETTTGGNALKFYASCRLDIRRTGSIKLRDEVVGNNVRSEGGQKQGRASVPRGRVRHHVRRGHIQDRRGHRPGREGRRGGEVRLLFSYDSQRIGQGRENVREFLKKNPDIATRIEAQVRSNAAPLTDKMLVAPEAGDED